MSNEKRTPLVKVITPKGVAKFPYLTRPDTKFDPEGSYSVGVIVTKSEVASIIEQLQAGADASFAATQASLKERMAEAKGEQKGKLKKELAELKTAPIPVKPVYDEEGDETDKVELKFSMKAQYTDRKTQKVVRIQPGLFDAAGKKLGATVDIWSGSVIKVGGVIKPYYTAVAGAGAKLQLEAVKVYALVTKGSGGADKYGFGDKEDGYEGDESDASAAGFRDDDDEPGAPVNPAEDGGEAPSGNSTDF